MTTQKAMRQPQAPRVVLGRGEKTQEQLQVWYGVNIWQKEAETHNKTSDGDEPTEGKLIAKQTLWKAQQA